MVYSTKTWCLLALAVTTFSVNGLHLADKYTSGVVDLYFNFTSTGLGFYLVRDQVTKMQGTFGAGIDFNNPTDLNFTISIADTDNGFSVYWTSDLADFQTSDCIDLQVGELNWYGGPQIYQQEWPIEKLQLDGNDPYVVRKDSNFAVPERYWLSSNGAFVYVDERSPLYVDQNVAKEGKICFIVKNTGPYFNRTNLYHHLTIGALDDPVSAHKFAASAFFPNPDSLPNQDMIKEPIWTTWAKYKRDITDENVREFFYNIRDHGFKGQIEIDEKWETCFGSRIFDPDKFSNITNVVKEIKDSGFRVTLWAAPFVNPDCTELIEEGEREGYYVKNTMGNMSTVWWESTDARQIDFTNVQAQEWYTEKLLRLLENPGVDGFKFDAGETDYVAQPGVYEFEDQELLPNIFTQKYINTVAQFGELIEARSAFRTQNYTLFLRMIDKDSVWGLDDGLQSLVTTLLQLNMVGYSFILPDMIGGNDYKAHPTLELLIRWTQATVFMPSMQFSFLPWDFEDDDQLKGTEIIKAMVDLHSKYAPKIVEAMEATIADHTPTNAPIWWIAPDDKVALQVNDEFLLGEDILVAPVLEEGATSRSVYLPSGLWVDGNDEEKTYAGPVTLDYDAPLAVLPYFIKFSE